MESLFFCTSKIATLPISSYLCSRTSYKNEKQKQEIREAKTKKEKIEPNKK